jgi:hypothetical protein
MSVRDRGTGRNPLDINWLEHRILDRLADKGQAFAIADMRDNLVSGHEESIVNLIFDMGREGWVQIFETPGGIKMVQITAAGRALLFDIMTSSKMGCD